MTGTSIATSPPEWLETSSTPPSGTFSIPLTSERYQSLTTIRSTGISFETYSPSRRPRRSWSTSISDMLEPPSVPTPLAENAQQIRTCSSYGEGSATDVSRPRQDGRVPPASLWVLHVDMDQFIAAVEVLRRPELAGQPVIVGGRGDPTERAVVSTASYEAREHGVHSGMPLRLAHRKSPDAVILPVDHVAYDAASAVVMDTLRAVPGVVVEVLGWDEAFVGLETDDPEAVARRIQADVLAATRLHCSVGIGDTKVRAKIATEYGKPRGTFRLTRENWFEVMGEKPTKELWGIGRRISERLAGLGISTVRELAETPDEPLAAEFG